MFVGHKSSVSESEGESEVNQLYLGYVCLQLYETQRRPDTKPYNIELTCTYWCTGYCRLDPSMNNVSKCRVERSLVCILNFVVSSSPFLKRYIGAQIHTGPFQPFPGFPAAYTEYHAPYLQFTCSSHARSLN